MDAWYVILWGGAVFFLIDLAYLYAAQFAWYIWYGTKYDTVPWLLSWMTNDAFIVTPGVDTGFSSANGGNFTPEQWQQIYNLLLLQYVLIILIQEANAAPPVMMAAAVDPSPTSSVIVEKGMPVMAESLQDIIGNL